jgi:hypothetical protein
LTLHGNFSRGWRSVRYRKRHCHRTFRCQMAQRCRHSRERIPSSAAATVRQLSSSGAERMRCDHLRQNLDTAPCPCACTYTYMSRGYMRRTGLGPTGLSEKVAHRGALFVRACPPRRRGAAAIHACALYSLSARSTDPRLLDRSGPVGLTFLCKLNTDAHDSLPGLPQTVRL